MRGAYDRSALADVADWLLPEGERGVVNGLLEPG